MEGSSRSSAPSSRIEVICDGGQPSRTWSEIDAMLADSSLNETVQASARRIFRCLGEAEAHVHKIALDDVHFHEVGAVDAIVDIVGSAIGLHRLDVDRIVCAPLPLSSGMTQGSHGSIPLPAPATLQILSLIRQFRRETGIFVAFTLDAGPNVHLIYPETEREKVLDFIRGELLAHCHREQWIDDRMGSGPVEITG